MRLITQAKQDRDDAVADMVTTHAWQAYALPALELHCRDIERNLACSINRPLEEIRSLQAEWALLQRIAENPVAFFSYNGEEG